MTREEWLDHTKEWSIDEFHAWRESKAAELEKAKAKNQRDVDSYVIKKVMGLLKQGMTIDAAGDWVLRNDYIGGVSEGVIITKEAALRSLRSIGWKPKDERQKGG